VVLGDFNGDGKTDLLRLHGSASGNSSVYLSNDAGGYTTVNLYHPLEIGVGDEAWLDRGACIPVTSRRRPDGPPPLTGGTAP